MSKNNYIDVKFCKPCSKPINKGNLSRHNKTLIHIKNVATYIDACVICKVKHGKEVCPARFNPDDEYLDDDDIIELEESPYRNEKCCNKPTNGFPCNICNKPSRAFLDSHPDVALLPSRFGSEDVTSSDIAHILREFSKDPKNKVVIIFK
jgi:hypothetical protein